MSGTKGEGKGARHLARVQDLIGVQDVLEVHVPGYRRPWGVVLLPGGDRYRVIVEARGQVNLGLLVEAEQDAAEDAWMAALRAVDFPLEIVVQSRPVALPELSLAGTTEGLARYAEAYRRHLLAWQRHTVQVRRVYLVVPADGKPLEEAVREMERRVRVLAGPLSRWVRLDVLGRDGVAALLAGYWRKVYAPQVESAAEWEWDSVVTEGVRLSDVREAVGAAGQPAGGSAAARTTS